MVRADKNNSRRDEAIEDLVTAIRQLSIKSETSIEALQTRAVEMQALNGLKFDHIKDTLDNQSGKIDKMLTRTARVEQQTDRLNHNVTELFARHNALALDIGRHTAVQKYRNDVADAKPDLSTAHKVVNQSRFTELDSYVQKALLMGGLLLILGVLKWAGLTSPDISPTEELIDIISP